MFFILSFFFYFLYICSEALKSDLVDNRDDENCVQAVLYHLPERLEKASLLCGSYYNQIQYAYKTLAFNRCGKCAYAPGDMTRVTDFEESERMRSDVSFV